MSAMFTSDCQNVIMFVKKFALVVIAIIIGCTVYHPGRHAKHYDYVRDEDVLGELVGSKRGSSETNLKDCRYADIVLNSEEINAGDVQRGFQFHLPEKGGEYKPSTCNPLFRTAIVIPYRKREQQLNTFLNYMHWFLQKQLIHYRIFVAEQNDSRPFNRAKMLNYGAKEAIRRGFDCVILHDVDLLPLTTGNIYACAKFPRHMSSSLDTFRFNLPYLGLFGGIVSIQSEQFLKVNGMSNEFDGWGGEDDDFFTRLTSHNILPYRFSPKLSKYTMLVHKKEKASEDRFKKLKSTLERQKLDGLNTLRNDYPVKLEPLYTHIYAP